ncbi:MULTISPECIES: protein translocase subunit SecF [unclassified Clostridium]|uniref:protein translocase subunit SecF n=1 Tax=unclassified Clostridium TaxID=2614128 RepID=UPI001105FA9C|nr:MULTISPECIES: protein translocase subunit SecF [unclassified Clostridium]
MKKFSFTKNVKYCLLISAVIILAGIVGLCTMGVNWGIDFTGGTIVTLDMEQEYDVADVQNALKALDLGDAPVSKSGDGDVKTLAVVRFKTSPGDVDEGVGQALQDALKDKYPNVRMDSMEEVGAVMGQELQMNALMSVGIACILILIYIAFRFEVYSAIVAVLALVHDVLIMFTFVVLLQVQVNTSFVAAMLTIVGYSINATIVVFDRIRENVHKMPSREFTRGQIVDTSIRETLTRSINTTLTTFIMIFLVYVMGVDSIKEFTLPIIVGLISGAFSSVFLAAPAWWLISGRDTPKKVKMHRRKNKWA